MSAHNLGAQLEQADLPLESMFVYAAHAMNRLLLAPTVSIAGGEAGTVAIGIDSDANGAALSKTAATARTGITGVQAPTVVVQGNSTLEIEVIGSCDLQAVKFAASDVITDTYGPRHFIHLPEKVDRRKPIYVSIVWTHKANAVGSRSITWRVLYESIKHATANGLTNPQPTTDLDTLIAAQAPSGATDRIEKTEPGVINANTIEDDYPFLHLSMGASAIDASFTESIFLIGALIEYSRRWTRP